MSFKSSTTLLYFFSNSFILFSNLVIVSLPTHVSIVYIFKRNDTVICALSFSVISVNIQTKKDKNIDI